MRTQPGAQERPAALHRVDVNFVEAIAVLAATVVDGAVFVAPFGQAAIDIVLVGIDRVIGGDGGFNEWADSDLFHVREHAHDDHSLALNHPEYRRLFLGQRATSRGSF